MYRQIETIQEILFVDQSRPFCELHRRLGPDRWLVDLIRPPKVEVALESIGVTLSLQTIYEGLDLLPV